ncbi:MAG: Riboflavin transporter [Alphaproteobacteria bacterium MarineAlpha11_Bin1]|nr:MAG: Riboflavin transporter [Alphaproteobacteria bacterium MarineAlpha11_Bin1]
MVASTLAFSGMHTTIKHVSGDVDTFIIVFFRNLFGFVALMPLFLRHGLAPLKTNRIGTHTMRVIINFVSMVMFFYALSITPLAEVAALTFSAPIFATVLAIFIFKETVGLGRWLAIFIGFAGTVVILRPGFEAVNVGSLLAIGAALLWGSAVMIIKDLGRTDSALTITTYMVLLLIPISLVPALFVWEWPSWEQLGWLLIVGICGSAGHLLLNLALKEAPTNVVMPIDFVRLIWVAIFGYFLFGEIPDIFIWIGGAMIFASGLWIAHAENLKRKQEK